MLYRKRSFELKTPDLV